MLSSSNSKSTRSSLQMRTLTRLWQAKRTLEWLVFRRKDQQRLKSKTLKKRQALLIRRSISQSESLRRNDQSPFFN